MSRSLIILAIVACVILAPAAGAVDRNLLQAPSPSPSPAPAPSGASGFFMDLLKNAAVSLLNSTAANSTLAAMAGSIIAPNATGTAWAPKSPPPPPPPSPSPSPSPSPAPPAAAAATGATAQLVLAAALGAAALLAM